MSADTTPCLPTITAGSPLHKESEGIFAGLTDGVGLWICTYSCMEAWLGSFSVHYGVQEDLLHRKRHWQFQVYRTDQHKIITLRSDSFFITCLCFALKVTEGLKGNPCNTQVSNTVFFYILCIMHWLSTRLLREAIKRSCVGQWELSRCSFSGYGWMELVAEGPVLWWPWSTAWGAIAEGQPGSSRNCAAQSQRKGLPKLVRTPIAYCA